MRPTLRRRSARWRADRGVSAVEAAFVVPVFVFLAVGIAEFGVLLARSNDGATTVRSMAMAAARTGAMRSGDWDVLRVLVSADRGFAVDRVVIYRVPSTALDGRVPAACLTAAAAAAGGMNSGTVRCNVYAGTRLEQVLDGTADADDVAAPGCTGWDQQWCPTGRSTSTDRIGVHVVGTQPMLTGIFGQDRRMVEWAVSRFDVDPDQP